MDHLCLSLRPHLIPRFYPFLQKGVELRGEMGCSVKAFLCEQLGIPRAYVEERIQTLFLDGQPVDDVESAVVRDGSTLALSAAMPGFAGAALRKGGYYAKMRSTITYTGGSGTCQRGKGKVVLKLFNHIIGEQGAAVLERGVWMRGEELGPFLERQPEDFWESCEEIRLEGAEIDRERLMAKEWAGEVFLQIHASAS